MSSSSRVEQPAAYAVEMLHAPLADVGGLHRGDRLWDVPGEVDAKGLGLLGYGEISIRGDQLVDFHEVGPGSLGRSHGFSALGRVAHDHRAGPNGVGPVNQAAGDHHPWPDGFTRRKFLRAIDCEILTVETVHRLAADCPT